MTTELFGSDAYAPGEVARRVETVGVAKAQMALLPLTCSHPAVPADC